MKILRFDNVIDAGDIVYIYRNRPRDFYISPKETYAYSASDPFVVTKVFNKVTGGDDEDPIVQKYAKITDKQTKRTFEISYSSLSMKPDNVNVMDRVVRSIILIVISFIIYAFYLLWQ